jgi:hypothetical protein
MTELSDYRRMIERPMLASKDAEIARLRTLNRKLVMSLAVTFCAGTFYWLAYVLR